MDNEDIERCVDLSIQCSPFNILQSLGFQFNSTSNVFESYTTWYAQAVDFSAERIRQKAPSLYVTGNFHFHQVASTPSSTRHTEHH